MKRLWILGFAACLLLSSIGVGSASATKLYKYTTPSANDGLGVGTVIEASLVGSTELRDTSGFLHDTCTSSSMKAEIENAGGSPGVGVNGPVSVLTFGGCSHTTHVRALGRIAVENIAGTTIGTVYSKEAEVTVVSTIFGISCVARTGTNTLIGELLGAKSVSGHAEVQINGVISLGALCGDSNWKGTYKVTSPTALTVEAS